MNKQNDIIEIPFGAKDSELYRWEYTIPEGYEAEIKDGKVIVKKVESKDEKIRKRIEQLIRLNTSGSEKSHLLAWLEKQKDITSIVVSNKDWDCQMAYSEGYQKGMADSNKPAEWSEEDETYLKDALWCVDEVEKRAKDENDRGACWSARRWLKDLPNRISLSHWKPTEEQMKSMDYVVGKFKGPSNLFDNLMSLYEQLKKL